VALPAIIAASVTILVNAGLERTWQLITRLWNLPRADNGTLTSAGFLRDDGGRTVVMCVVRCAPSRRFRRPQPIDHDAVGALVKVLAPDLPPVPDRFDKDGVRFQTPGPFGFGPETFVNVQASGLVEFGAPLSEFRSADGFTLSLTEVGMRIEAMVTQVRRGHYRHIFHTIRRLDWALSVSGYVRVEPTNQSEPWTGLTVGNNLVGGRATNSVPSQPIAGQFGEDDLKNLWPWTKPDKVIRGALKDWLLRSGYWKPDPTVHEVIAHAARRERAST
jgi:hypothetical protein